MKLLLKNAIIIDPVEGEKKGYDVLIDTSGKIEDVCKNIKEQKNIKSIDCSGNHLFPGFIDPHVHLREPGFEDREDIESGAYAALRGGFVGVLCMPNTNPPLDSGSLVHYVVERSKKLNLCEVFPAGCITKAREGKEISEIGDMVEKGAKAISDDGKWVQNSDVMRKALEYSVAFDIPVISHCEDSYLVEHGVANESAEVIKIGLKGRPREAEVIAIFRDITLSKKTNAHLHIAHISTKESLEIIKRAKEENVKVTCEVTPHHLSLTQESILDYNTMAKVNPPLREEEDRIALVNGVKKGIIDFLASDHAPHLLLDKEKEFSLAPSGISGLETAFSIYYETLVLKNNLSLQKLSELISYNPAKFLKLKNLGRIKKGYTASFTLVDLKKEWVCRPENFFSKGKNTPFAGKRMKGKVLMTIVSGKIFDWTKEDSYAQRSFSSKHS